VWDGLTWRSSVHSSL